MVRAGCAALILLASCGGKAVSSVTGSGGSPGNGGSGATVAQGGASSQPSDPYYPYVDHSGAVEICPEFGYARGSACWYFDGRSSTPVDACDPAACNACSCLLRCDIGGSDGEARCPAALTGGATPECIRNTPTSIGFCFLTCDASGPCPDAMTCVPYPDLPRSVCVWLTH